MSNFRHFLKPQNVSSKQPKMRTKNLHIYFFISSIVTFLIGQLNLNYTIFDININDGFYVFELLFTNFYSLILLIISIALMICNKLEVKLNPKIAKIHCIITIGFIFLLWIVNLCLKLNGIPYSDNLTRNVIFTSLLFLILIIQLFYIITIVTENSKKQ